MKKFLLIGAICVAATAAMAANGPAVFDLAGNEIGVVQSQNADGSYVVLPMASAGLGSEPLTIGAANMKTRPKGGLTTSLSIDQLGDREMQKLP